MNCESYVQSFHNEMRLRRFAFKTRKSYGWHVERFLNRHKEINHPKSITEQDIKSYLSTVTPSSLVQAISSIKLFYEIIVRQPRKFIHTPYPRRSHSLPEIVSHEHILKSIAKIQNVKHRAIISLLYDTGIRVSEVCNLRIENVDSDRMVITIREGKGSKDRQVKLSRHLLNLLRGHCSVEHPCDHLFVGQDGGRYSVRSIQTLCEKFVGVHPHTLRHCFAVKYLEDGGDLFTLKNILGHKDIKTTSIYLHLTSTLLSRVRTPLEIAA